MREYRPEVIAESVLQEYRALGAPPGSRRYFQSGRWGYELGKRIFDIVIASLGCVVATPVLLITGLAVWWRMGRPVLFRQLRPGLHGRPFELLKFRTMRCEFDGEGLSLPDEERLTALGQFLRSTSLDELPALWNVLKGELSLVGPRPLLMEYLPLYTERQALRHCVKPGMTGWAQVGGRNSLAWEDKFELDLWYVENRSFRLDLAILIATVRHVWRREGISQPGSATAERFRGSQR